MESEFIGFAASVLGVSREEMSLSSACGDFPAWDSTAHLHLVIETESRYGVKYSLEEVPKLRTLGDMFRPVREKAFLDAMDSCLETGGGLSFDTVLRDVDGWCSLTAFAVLIALERKFGVTLEISALAECVTVGDVAVSAGIARA